MIAMKTLSLDEFLARAAANPAALAHLAGVFFNMGDKARAAETALRALTAAPGDVEVRSLASTVLSANIPDWHFGIVRDAVRNAAYEAALKRAVTARTKVLEIGAGTGILAMIAARVGAQTVVTCEMVPAVAQAARDIVARNGFADRVRVVAKKSYDLDPDADLGGRADVLVYEIVDNTMLREDVLPVTEHAVKTLLNPGAKVIPARGIVRVALANDAAFDHKRLGIVEGFDLSPFNRLARSSYRIKHADAALTLLSPPGDLFDFDFQSGGPFPPATASTTVISTGGQANGIAQWIALRMDDEGWYENDPRTDSRSAWAVKFWPFIAARDYPLGASIKVSGSHDRRELRIWA